MGTPKMRVLVGCLIVVLGAGLIATMTRLKGHHSAPLQLLRTSSGSSDEEAVHTALQPSVDLHQEQHAINGFFKDDRLLEGEWKLKPHRRPRVQFKHGLAGVERAKEAILKSFEKAKKRNSEEANEEANKVFLLREVPWTPFPTTQTHSPSYASIAKDVGSLDALKDESAVRRMLKLDRRDPIPPPIFDSKEEEGIALSERAVDSVTLASSPRPHKRAPPTIRASPGKLRKLAELKAVLSLKAESRRHAYKPHRPILAMASDHSDKGVHVPIANEGKLHLAEESFLHKEAHAENKAINSEQKAASAALSKFSAAKHDVRLEREKVAADRTSMLKALKLYKRSKAKLAKQHTRAADLEVPKV